MGSLRGQAGGFHPPARKTFRAGRRGGAPLRGLAQASGRDRKALAHAEHAGPGWDPEEGPKDGSLPKGGHGRRASGGAGEEKLLGSSSLGTAANPPLTAC